MSEKLRKIYEIYLRSINIEYDHIRELIRNLNYIFYPRVYYDVSITKYNDPVVKGVMTCKNQTLIENIPTNTKFIKPGDKYIIRILYYQKRFPKMRIYYDGKGWKTDRPKMEFIDFLCELNINHNKLAFAFEKHIFDFLT